jgi:nicotinamide-nucleotide amidase
MKPIYAETITIGDEILYGQIVDTNSQFMSVEFDKIGIKVIRRTSIGDTKTAIVEALQAAEKVADIIMITGGLGPTKDDITKKTLAEYFGCELVMNDNVLAHITNLFTARGRAMNESTKTQALVPTLATVIHNAEGTAPGMWFEKNGKIFVSMPGVPHETEKMIKDIILPKIKQQFKLPEIIHRFIKVVNIAESSLSELIEAWELALPTHIKLAYLPSKGQIKLRLTALGESAIKLNQEIDDLIAKVNPLIKQYIFGYDGDEIEHTVAKLLIESKQTIATAESCTGGLLAHSLTQYAGSSQYFLGTVVSYSNASKTDLLGVDANIIAQKGAVSEEVVKQMAISVREKFKADIGVATTGVAGPDGGSPEKPVGTIWIAYADKNGVQTKLLTLTKNRLMNINMTKNFVWNYVRIKLSGGEPNEIVK